LAGIKEVVRNFRYVKNKLSSAILECSDFRDVIRKYDSKGTLFYLDPPYYRTNENAYIDTVKPMEVYEVLKDIEGKFILSYNDHYVIRKLFDGYTILECTTKYELGKKERGYVKEARELLICNYEVGVKFV